MYIKDESILKFFMLSNISVCYSWCYNKLQRSIINVYFMKLKIEVLLLGLQEVMMFTIKLKYCVCRAATFATVF